MLRELLLSREKYEFLENPFANKIGSIALDFETKFLEMEDSLGNSLKSEFSSATNLEEKPLSFKDSLSLRAANPAPPVCPVEICKTEGSDPLMTLPPFAQLLGFRLHLQVF